MQKAPDLEELQLRTGVLLNEHQGVILAGHNTLEEEDVAHTIEFMWRRDSEWAGRSHPWTGAAVGYAPQPIDRGVSLGENGDFHTWGNRGESSGRVAEHGIFRSVKTVGRHAYAVGMSATIYRYTSVDLWERLNLSLPRDLNFESITGFSEEEMYAVGWKGAICRIGQQDASLVDSPTNLILTDACCGDDGFVYCCGQNGIILKGRDQQWDVIPQEETQEDFWSVVSFRGNIYISSASFLYTLEQGRLQMVSFGADIPRSCYHLSTSGENYLWSIGPQDLMGYDGNTWDRIL